MHLLARHPNGTSVPAWEAEKGMDYFCLECGDPVRLRSGLYRQSHFYHIQPRQNCRQSGKSITHLQVQLALLRLLPHSALEVPFPTVRRIADVVWEEKKLIFEVQCSPIDGEEVLARNRDYASLGFQVVWILHDQCFNKRHLTAAEYALGPHPHYFTNFTAEGEGIFYDQLSQEKRGARKTLVSHLPVSLHKPIVSPSLFPPRKSWNICFQGDARTVLPAQSLLLHSSSIFTRLKNKYIALLHFLLEKTSK